MNKFLITTTLPYVNAEPHIGFAMEIVRADCIVRYKKIKGYEVFFNTGTDEHGIKIYKKAEEQKKDTQKYVDEYADKFKELIPLLGISEDIHFTRTTNPDHKKAAQEFWKICDKNGYIYKKNYKVKYCIGCELEKTDSELVDGRCSLHPNQDLEIIEEENYFFKFSAFQEKLDKFYSDNPNFIIPNERFNEIKAFNKRGLEDFSISRLKNKMPWGVPVPNDDEHVMYVWFDALVNYLSTLGWPNENYKDWWNVGLVQYCGKDNTRQQGSMWQAMLMAADIKPSKTIVVNGFIMSEGKKMSKSLGNVINPKEILDIYGKEAFRYFMTREFNTFEDSDVYIKNLVESYNANLSNGLGNLVNRVIQMAISYEIQADISNSLSFDKEFEKAMDEYRLKDAMDFIWKKIATADQYIQKEEPFKKIKTDPEKAKNDVAMLLKEVANIAYHIAPFMPETSTAILDAIKDRVKPTLFPRK